MGCIVCHAMREEVYLHTCLRASREHTQTHAAPQLQKKKRNTPLKSTNFQQRKGLKCIDHSPKPLCMPNAVLLIARVFPPSCRLIENKDALMPDCGVHYLWFAFVCF